MTPLILYVDDDDSQRFAVRGILLGGGYRVLEGVDGTGTLALLDRSAAPDLAVLDLRLPDIDGHELARRIRARKGYETLPVVFLTSRRLDSSDRVKALGEGADGCLQLPIVGEELLAIIRSVMRLRSAEMSARDAVAVREDLLALVSHDLKNPLAALLISVTLLNASALEGPEGDLVRRHAGIIVRAASRMDRLISDLADLAWIESGRLTLSRERLSAEAVLRDAIDAHQGIATAGGVTLTLEGAAPGRELPVFADRHRLAQVLANLITNAIKFTPPQGTVTVSVETQQGSDQGSESTVMFRVRDTGTGIPPGDHDKLFDRFWQAAETSEKGTGLGLSIAKAIVEAHGGTIGVMSEPGTGSTFSFTIPRA